MNADLHKDLIVIDGLNVSRFNRSVFEDLVAGGVTAANCTCSVWENFRGTMNNIAIWNQMFRDQADLIRQVKTAYDVVAAKNEGKAGIILGFQNISAFEDQLGYIEIFKKLGVGIVQMAYNTRNLAGSGCYEEVDGGLSGFGREMVAEMNRVGIMCDLSHVGPVTSKDVIEFSQKPVAYSHCLPAGLKDHPRNKSDDQLKFIADRGGFIGVTMFAPFLKQGIKATVDDYVAAIDYVIDLVGDDCVGIGTDFTQGYGPEFFEWITRDKGYGRKLTEFGEIVNPEGFRTIDQFPNLTGAMLRAGWSEKKIRKVMGLNWLGVLKKVWEE